MGARQRFAGPAISPSPPETLDMLRGMIAERRINLPRKQEMLLRYMIENPAEAALSTYRSVAAATGTSPGSVRELIHNLGFQSLDELRELFRNALRGDPRRSTGR